MNSNHSLINRYAVAIFCALAILLSFATYFLPLPREVLPFVIVCIPPILAIFLTAITDGRSGVRSLLRKLVEWRISLGWLATALAVAFAMRLAVSLLALALGMIPVMQLRPTTVTEVVMLAVIFLLAGILEEWGWRGYVLPKLLKTQTALFASLVIGVLWGLLHLALHLPGMPSNGLPLLPTMLQLIGLSIILTWFFIRGGRNIILTTIFHAAQSFFVILNGGISLAQQQWLMAVVWVATGVIIVLASRPMQRLSSPTPV
ncbi:MAG TPA: CPBP family glutamic-type intramembrane protease [Chloroflexota bacterium]|nr:CPBP family glutamic-type intramembrane protease [Chloroflexota bacterium]HUM68226.1 CPBP family glutamic-type intramembrane protease [Chloroflexota bacterium]